MPDIVANALILPAENRRGDREPHRTDFSDAQPLSARECHPAHYDHDSHHYSKQEMGSHTHSTFILEPGCSCQQDRDAGGEKNAHPLWIHSQLSANGKRTILTSSKTSRMAKPRPCLFLSLRYYDVALMG